MSGLNILRAAPAMQFQDLGRFGQAHIGLSQGGPIDLHAHCWANFLLDNAAKATTIEISYGNCAIQAEVDCIIAITGAEMNAHIDAEPISNWSSHFIRKGQTLKLNYASKGIHAYLAIQHGFQAPRILGSSATVVRNGIGRLLKSETKIDYSYHAKAPKALKRTPSQYLPDYDSTDHLRLVLPSDQDPEFQQLLLSTEFTISQHSDRMGINLTATPALPALPGIISEGISLGAIQLLPSGNPIILMNDRQTQGGYAKIGNIARLDLPLLAQARPGSDIKLLPIPRQQALTEWREFARFFSLE